MSHPIEISMSKEQDFVLQLLVLAVGHLGRGYLLERFVWF